MLACKVSFPVFHIDSSSLNLYSSVTYYFPKITDCKKVLAETRQAMSIILASTYLIYSLYRHVRGRAISKVSSSRDQKGRNVRMVARIPKK